MRPMEQTNASANSAAITRSVSSECAGGKATASVTSSTAATRTMRCSMGRKGHGQRDQQHRSHQDYALFHGERLDGSNALRIVRSY
jgi:hypothetical protein